MVTALSKFIDCPKYESARSRESTTTMPSPDDFLRKKKGITLARARERVLNHTLIDRTTNQMIGNRAPTDYMTEIRNTRASRSTQC